MFSLLNSAGLAAKNNNGSPRPNSTHNSTRNMESMMSIALAQKNETFQIVLRDVIRQHLFPKVKFVKKIRI